MRRLNFIFVLLLPFGLIACNSIEVGRLNPQVPSPVIRVDTLGVRVASDIQRRDRIEVVQDAGQQPPNLSGGSDTNATDLTGHIALTAGRLHPSTTGFLDKVEIGVGADIYSSTFFEMKAQLLGPPSSDVVINQIYVAAFMRSYNEMRNTSRKSGLLSSNSTNSWRAKVDSLSFGGGLTIGTYIREKLMVFGGFAYEDQSAAVRIDQDAYEPNSVPAATYDFQFQGYSRAASLGFRWGTSAAFFGTASYIEHQYFNRPMSRQIEAILGFEFYSR